MNMAGKAGRGFILALGAVLALAIFANATWHVDWILREPDLWWHIKTGQLILTSGHVPQTDTFSFTQTGQPWIAKEWLSQVIFALAYNAASWAGPFILAAAAMGLTGWLIYRRSVRDLQPVFAAALVIVSVFLVQGVTVARPHIFTFPIVVALAMLCFDAARSLKAPPWWSLILIVLWTNLHGSFAIAFLIAGCAFLDYLERARLSDRRTLIRWIVFGVLCALVTLINPYVLKPYQVALAMASGQETMTHISEWAPFTAPTNSVMEAGFMLVLFLLLKARAKFTFGQIIYTLMAFHMMLVHLRFLYIFFLSVPLVLLPEIVAAVPQVGLAVWLARPRDGLERFVDRFGRPIAGLAAVVFVGLLGFLLGGSFVKPPEATAITGALAYVDATKARDPMLQKNVFNDFNYGGPLILDGIKTYVDDRAEQLYLGDFMPHYLDAASSNGKEALAQILSDPQIGWAIFPVKDPREENMKQMPGWHQTYADTVAAIWERVSP